MGGRLAIQRHAHLNWWHTSYVASRTSAAEFGPVLLAEAARRGGLEIVRWQQPPGTDPRLAVVGPAEAVLRSVVVLGDGARWIWDLDVLRVERGYFTTNAARMDYPTFRARGLPIGSGAVESAARHVVQVRMKRPGMRWSRNGGEALLALCAYRASNRPLTLA